MSKKCSEKSCDNIVDEEKYKQCNICRERKRKCMADKRAKDKENNRCKALRKDDTQCTYKATCGNFCKKHFELGAVENQDIKQRCSDCNNHSDELNENNKTCSKCKERATKNRKKNKENNIICKGITQKGTPCSYKVVDGEIFCKKHLKVDKNEKYNKENNIVECSSNGCHQNVNGSGFSRCDDCRKKDREKTKNKKTIILNKNKDNIDSKICIKCNIDKPLSEFSTDSNYNGNISKCNSCRSKCKKIDDKRCNRYDKKKSLVNNYYEIKRSAEKRNIDFNLDKNYVEKLVISECFYCGSKSEKEFLNGIDRLNSTIGYTEDNCISCCNTCNIIKGSLDPTTFINRCEHICTYRGLIEDGILYPELFCDHNSSTFSNYKNSATRRKKEFNIDKNIFEIIKKKNCYICGKKNSTEHTNGIDRIDSTKGYIIENIESCCGECNFMKNKFSLDLFLEKCYLNYQLNSTYADELSEYVCKNKMGIKII